MNEPTPNNFQKSLTTTQVIIRIVAIVSTAEFAIMLLLGTLKFNVDIYSAAAINLIFLALLSTPLIYLLVIKPFVVARDNALQHISLLAHTDPLTQLPNRRLISMHLEKCLAGAVRHKVRGAILLLDLDGFKAINDLHGHDAGDKVLIEVARRLKFHTRAEDVIGRIGGDEFIILIQHLDTDNQTAHDTVYRLAKKLVNAIHEPICFNDQTLNVSASIGIRLLKPEELDTTSIIREADAAMYHAKQAGKGRAVFFEE
jgi:two-component system cell cycle response regulator